METKLKQKLKTLPSAPGVYFHKNQKGEIIYVGKAAVLKNRVRQYFQNTEKDPKTQALVDEIADTDWRVVDTEMDALFLESEMIKRYMPKWNILLRDDKTVSYVRIDMKSEVPTVTITRQPEGDDATYIGPFYAKTTIATALRILRKIFPYYNKPYDGKKTLNTDLGLTPGIEIGKTTPKEYKKTLRSLIRYLEGDREKLIKDLEKQMKIAAKTGDYETAAKLRDQFFGLKGLKKKIVFSDREFLDLSSDLALKQLQTLLKLQHPPKRIEGYDVSHISGTDVVASMVVFTNGAADRSEYRKFKLKKQQNDDTASLKEVLTRRFKHKDWTFPDVILLDGGKPQFSAAKEALESLGLSNIPIISRDKSGNHAKNASVVILTSETGESIIGEPVRPTGRTRAGEPHNDDASEREDKELASCPEPRSDVSERDGREPSVSPITLSPVSPTNDHLARLIARIDEEAHRFAITYHRHLRSKRLTK